MKVLHLTLKKQWFDMILSGEKKEEYRDQKPYWRKRLMELDECDFKQFDQIIFKNGYAKNAPQMVIECKEICYGYPDFFWSDFVYDKEVYVIKLGNIISTQNCNP